MGAEPADEDIATWQADWNLPEDILGDVVRRATGSGMAQHERLLEGHENEVHDVATKDGQRVIVRVGWRPGPAFERERWPMDAARRAGLPVPEVLLIEHTSLGDTPVSFNVQQRMPGRPIHRLRASLGDEELTALTQEVGRLLAALHTIETPGRGPIGPDGMVDLTLGPVHSGGDLDGRTAFLLAHGVDRALVEEAVALVVASQVFLDAAPVRLTHGDWTLANLLAEGDSLTGVVDWGGGGGDPASELKGWDFWHDYGPTATDVLLAGYTEGGGCVDEGFQQRRLVYRVLNLHDAMSHFIVTNRPDLLDKATTDLELALRTARKVL